MNKSEDKYLFVSVGTSENKIWKNKEGQLHRIDGPAIEYADGGKEWFLNGLRHREDGPAIEWSDGSKYWYLNGKRHRIDGPAFEGANGSKSYYIEGKSYTSPKFIKYLQDNNLPIPDLKELKRYMPKVKSKSKDEPTEIDSDGNKYWRNKAGQLHRIGGPAFEGANGDKSWVINGELHRLDGPAIEKADGTKAWYLYGKEYTEEDFNKEILKMNKVKDEPTEIDKFGNKYWRNKEGRLHREDGPAVEYSTGSKEWWVNGKRHRIDGPAIEWANGYKSWHFNDKQYTEEEFNKEILKMNKAKDEPTEIDFEGSKLWKNKKGQLHRIDGPAEEKINGNKYWYFNGKLHRIDGPAIETASGNKYWFINGKLHRIDGPAVEYTNGHKEWWFNGKRHRLDGPAIIWPDGSKEWWINGKYYIEENFNKEILKINKAKDAPSEVDLAGNKIWKNKEGQIHREDGPAIEYANGDKHWFINGKWHRKEKSNKEIFKMNKSKDESDKNIEMLILESYDGKINDQLMSEKDIQINELIKKNKELEERLISLESENKKTDKTTANVLMNTSLDAFKLAGARQSTRVLVSLTKEIIKILNSKTNFNLDFLDTDAGTAILEIIAPLIIHALATNQLIPKFSQQLELVSKMGIQANTTFYIMKYSDEITDTIKQVALNPELRTKFNELISVPENMNVKIVEPLFA